MLLGVVKLILNFLSSWIHVFQQSFKGCVGSPMVDRQAKIIFPTNSRVIETMHGTVFSNIFCICKCKNLPVRRVSSFVFQMVLYPVTILVYDHKTVLFKFHYRLQACLLFHPIQACLPCPHNQSKKKKPACE